jgi:hypothetical protein
MIEDHGLRQLLIQCRPGRKARSVRVTARRKAYPVPTYQPGDSDILCSWLGPEIAKDVRELAAVRDPIKRYLACGRRSSRCTCLFCRADHANVPRSRYSRHTMYQQIGLGRPAQLRSPLHGGKPPRCFDLMTDTDGSSE